MEHKFIIEVTLKHIQPTGAPQVPQAPQGAAVNLDPKVLATLLPQLTGILASLPQPPRPTGHPPQPTGQPPRPQ